MKPNLSGKWSCHFLSPSNNHHEFTLELDQSSGVPLAKMHLSQRKAGGGVLEVDFGVHVEVCDRFVAFLAKDAAKDSLGINAMLLEASDDAQVLSGRIIWNSLSSKDIQVGTVKWNRVLQP